MNTSIQTNATMAVTLSPVAVPNNRIIEQAKSLVKRGAKKVRVWLARLCSARPDSYERWRELEYRNEMATRLGERMNPYSIC